MRAKVVIVGAGSAGAECAISLAKAGFLGSILLISEHGDPPYELPPLTKEYLSGKRELGEILIRPADFWSRSGIEILRGKRVTRVFGNRKVVRCDDGEELEYDQLVWAAGARARKLHCDGGDLADVHTIRTRSDAEAIRNAARHSRHVVIIGGGYIGLEVAASLSKQDVRITVLEANGRILTRSTGCRLAQYLTDEHARHGVDIRTDVHIARMQGVSGKVSQVELTSGEILPADLVVVGVGIEPNVEPLVDVVEIGARGILANQFCRSSDPDIFVIGDCSEHLNSFCDDQRLRLESVQNATDQGKVVARNILGFAERYESVPWFWSDQYDLRIQTIGLVTGHDEYVVRGDVESRSFSLIYLKNGRVIAFDCINRPRDYIEGRKLVGMRALADAKDLADPTKKLRDIIPLESASE